MVIARRAVASRLGAAVVDKREMRVVAEDHGQPRVTVQARGDSNKKQIS